MTNRMAQLQFELPTSRINKQLAKFCWPTNIYNWLFVLDEDENGPTLRLILDVDGSGTESKAVRVPAEFVAKHASLEYAWNRSGNLLALAPAKTAQVVFFEPETGKFIAHTSDSAQYSIELMSWSNVGNDLIACCSDALIRVLNCDGQISVREIANNAFGEDKMRRLQVLDDTDVFVCASKSRVLVGSASHTYLYKNLTASGEICRAKLSPVFVDALDETASWIWLVYQTIDDMIGLDLIGIAKDERHTSEPETCCLTYDAKRVDALVVDLYFLDKSHTIVCYSSGVVDVLEIKSIGYNKYEIVRSTTFVVDDKSDESELMSSIATSDEFKSFELIKSHSNQQTRQYEKQVTIVHSLAAMTASKIFYYEAIVDRHQDIAYTFNFIDLIDMSENLSRVRLELVACGWRADGTQLAAQLSDGHLLIYRTRLRNYMLATHETKTAYLSDTTEVTLLLYERNNDESSGDQSPADASSSLQPAQPDTCCTLQLAMKPSLLALGPSHLAVALNNRVRYYALKPQPEFGNQSTSFIEQEYTNVVTSLSLGPRFVAVQFGDGRVKLHAIKAGKTGLQNDACERYFPDPGGSGRTKAGKERITATCVTDSLFLYCTQSLELHLFSLHNWINVRAPASHASLLAAPITRLRPNRGSACCKLVCIARQADARAANVILYDICTGTFVRLSANGDTGPYARLFQSQLPMKELLNASETDFAHTRAQTLNIVDAVWDPEEQVVLLVEARRAHLFAVFVHTLASSQDAPVCAEFIATVAKASRNSVLHIVNGLISLQTPLGHVINRVLETHDDDARLSQLESDVAAVRLSVAHCADDESHLAAATRVASLKLQYLRRILPLYSVSKSMSICDIITSDDAFRLSTDTLSERLRAHSTQLECIIYMQLAARALYTYNLHLALEIYRKHKLALHAHHIDELIRDAKNACAGLDAVASVRTRLLLLLNCDLDCGE